jgi:hypothetical protein
MNDIQIQIMRMNSDGTVPITNWETVRGSVSNNSQAITQSMNEVKKTFGERVRVRAIDSSGRMIDMLQ